MKCKNCGSEFSCGVFERKDPGNDKCWCMELPYLLAEYLPDEVGKDCLCQSCLLVWGRMFL